MKYIVKDEAVIEFANRIRNGVPSGALFPGKMSDCEFTAPQRELIRKARAELRATRKASKKAEGPSTSEEEPISTPGEPKNKPLTKLRKMLYLQSGRCFFCSEPLNEEEASIEHLQPLSRGGTRVEDNEVVCHRSLNETFGQMDLKRKVEFILNSSGKFHCPRAQG